VLIVLVLTIGLSPEQLVTWATGIRYQAVFTEAGGLAAGDDVIVSGVKVGTVSTISLQKGKAVVDFTVRGTVRLGDETTGHIKTGSLLGQRDLTLNSAGSTALGPGAVIPASRTSSPYSLTEALGTLTTDVAGTDTGQLNKSLDTLSATLDQIAPQLGPTFEALTRVSQSINGRNDSLRQLLSSASDVTDVLSQRSQEVNSLILNANSLLGVLVERRQAIVDLLANISAMAKQLSGLVADNEAQLAPTLDRLNSVAAMLENNRDNIAKALPNLAKVATTQGEAVNNGAYYNAFVANIPSGQVIQPFIDAVLGIQPRALFPWPNCGGEQNGFIPPFNFDHCLNREESDHPFTQQYPR
jgi:phospholipid/cholesterol/gamma-HCH transport system substrate-binding protein